MTDKKITKKTNSDKPKSETKKPIVIKKAKEAAAEILTGAAEGAVNAAAGLIKANEKSKPVKAKETNKSSAPKSADIIKSKSETKSKSKE